MHDIAERTVLLRGSMALPYDFELVKAEFQEGWNLVQSGDALARAENPTIRMAFHLDC